MDKSFLELSQNHARMIVKSMIHNRIVNGNALQVQGACMGLSNQAKTDLRHVKKTPKTYRDGPKKS